jgi:hypothetical protein
MGVGKVIAEIGLSGELFAAGNEKIARFAT